MKALLLALAAICTFALSADAVTAAGRNYKVTITVESIAEYYDASSNQFLGNKSLGTTTQTLTLYAETPDEAEQKAKQECSYMCNSIGTYQGEGSYNGKRCKIYLSRRVITARAN